MTAKNKYKACTAVSVVAPADPTTPFFLIEGSSSAHVKVKKLIVTGPTLTAVEYNSIVAIKHSTAASGGTPVVLTKVPLDSNAEASSANKCQVYTAAPTPGTAVGVVACRRVLFEAGTAVAGSSAAQLTMDFGDEGVVLHGVAQGLSLNFGSDPASAVTLAVEVEWEEVPL